MQVRVFSSTTGRCWLSNYIYFTQKTQYFYKYIFISANESVLIILKI